MRRIAALCTLLLLAACAGRERLGAPMIEAEAVYEAAPSCSPGEGDGIGGTGCKAPVN